MYKSATKYEQNIYKLAYQGAWSHRFMKVVGLLGVLLVPLRRLLLGLLPVPLRRLLLGVAPVLLQVVLLQLLPERNPGLLVSPTMWADTPRPVPSSASSVFG